MEMTHWNEPPRHSVRLPSVPTSLARFLPWIALGVIAFGLLNAGWQMSDSASLGGDALNGYVREGHYFVGSHGSYTEVGAAEWMANRDRSALTLISWPFVMLAAAFLLFRYVFPYVMSGGRTQPDQERVARIRGSGPMLASADPGGRVGDVRMIAGMLGVDVYDAGLVIRPRFMPPFAIPVEEIRSLRHGRSLLSKRLEIEHDGLEVASTVALFMGEDSHVARAITAIMAERTSHGLPGALQENSRSASAAATPAMKPSVPLLIRLMSVMGLFVGGFMIFIGVTRAIPTLGVFGVVWTAFGVAILAVNVVRFVRRGY